MPSRHLFLTAALFLTTLTPGVAAAQSCTLEILADFPVTYLDGHLPVITVKIKGVDERFLVDSGSKESYLSLRAYNALNLTRTYAATGTYTEGYGGTVQTDTMVEQNLAIGHSLLKDVVLMVADQAMPTKNGKPLVDGVLGYAALQQYDIGLDLPDNKMTFYELSHCATPALPWTGDYLPVHFTRPNGYAPVIEAAIDNQPFKLTLDTGAYSTMILESALKTAGVKPEALEHGANLTATGFGDLPFGMHMAEFSSVTIGAEGFSDDWLAMDVQPARDMEPTDDGGLGEDYFATHRVFISNASYTAYLGLSTQ